MSKAQDAFDEADRAYLEWRRSHPGGANGEQPWDDPEGARLAQARDEADAALAAEQKRD
ncbi:MAG: hypothetical protein K0S70_468 [Microbacterium sp.]|jgi:hypothetical protein|nr:hypothetical protein [Microbacterium sp.]